MKASALDPAWLGTVLAQPGEAARRCIEERDLRRVAATALAAMAFGGAVFGGVMGSYRAGPQIAYAALKMPVVLLATLALSGPALHAIAVVLGRPWSLRAALALGLSAGARAALVLLSLAPVLWLVIDAGCRYEAVQLVGAFAYGAAGVAALGVVLRALGDGPGRVLAAAFMAVTVSVVGGQCAWILRPYIGRPSDASVPFLVSRKEGGVVDVVARAAAAVVGGRRQRGHDAP